MPHITIEYTSNISESNQLEELFHPLHQLIVKRLDANIDHCKTKAFKADYCLKALGEEGFVMVTIVLKKGRSREMIESAASEIMQLLKGFFAQSISENANVTLEFKDLSEFYYKR